MALYVKDAEVDQLADRLAQLRNLSKTEIVRQALQHELERLEAEPTLVEQGLAFMRALKARGDVTKSEPVDKAFIDSLYEAE